MKKSFLKRAIASVVSVPLALTQCLMPVLAVDNVTDITPLVDTATTKHFTADSLTNIAPNAIESEWNLEVAGIISSMSDFTDRALNPAVVCDLLIARAGKYADIAEKLAENITDTTVSYSFVESAITLKGKVDDIGYLIGEEVQKRLDKQIAGVVKEYEGSADLSSIKNVDFSGLQVAADVEIVIDISDIMLNSGKTANVTYTFKTEDGNTYTLDGDSTVMNYVSDKYEQVRSLIMAATDDVDVSIAEGAAAVDAIKNYVKLYDGRMENLKKKYKNGLNRVENGNITISGSDLKTVLAEYKQKMIDRYPNAADKFDNYYPIERIPTSAADVANRVAPIYAELLNSVSDLIPSNVDFDVDVNEVAAIFDNLYDVTLNVNGGVAVLEGYMNDDQIDEVKAYYETQGKEVISSIKKVEASFPATGEGEVYYNVTRILELKDIETTTTTTVTTTNTDTVTTTVTSGEDTDVSGTVTTVTTGEGTDVSTSTTTGDINSNIVEVKVVIEGDGFYYSHDDEAFADKEGFSVFGIDPEGNEIALTSDDYTLNFNSPLAAAEPKQNLESWTEEDFQYEITASVGDVTSEPVIVYIGHKGDANLDNTVDAGDSSSVLAYYAAKQANENPSIYSTSNELYESFVLFLVDTNEDASLDAGDASDILNFYAEKQSNPNKFKALKAIGDFWFEKYNF